MTENDLTGDYMNNRSSLLKEFDSIEKEISQLRGIHALLHWDSRVNMPSAASGQRGEQEALIDGKMHELLTSKRLIQIIHKLSEKSIYDRLSKTDKRRVDLYNWLHKRLINIPKAHIEELSRATASAHHAWLEARKKESFKIFLPHVKRMFELKKKSAKYVDAKADPYDIILDEYERGLTKAKIDKVFSVLKPGLLQMLSKIRSSPRYEKIHSKRSILRGEFPKETQLDICQDMIKRIFVDMDKTMLAETVHPFMTRINACDMRITTAVRKDPTYSFFSTVHETGHALYELGFDRKILDTITSGFGTISYPLHESQSRIWENIIIDSQEFWKTYYPYYSSRFPALKKIPMQDFYEAINIIEPSFVRTEADELTYGLHIIIRYELEKDLMEGTLKVEDLEKAWNKKYKEYLGITPRKPSEGILQDSHWASGNVGYFPTYLYGSIYSVMLFNAMEKAHPGIYKDIGKLDFTFIRSWLKDNVHRYAAGLDTEDIIRKACGKEMDIETYTAYLKKKYYKIYGIKD